MIWELPVIALRSIVVLPGTTTNVDVGRAKSKRAIDEAQASDRRVLLLTQREQRTDDPTLPEMFDIGVLAVIKQVVRLPDSTLQVLVEAQERARVGAVVPGPYLRVKAETLPKEPGNAREAEVFLAEAKTAFEEYQRQNKNLRLDNYQVDAIRGRGETH